MKRNYSTGVSDTVDFFEGYEVEHTPAFGLITLFVVGIQSIDKINEHFNNNVIEHIFFGANHSYHPLTAEEYDQWEAMISYFLEKEILCSLDIPFTHVENFNEGGLCEYNNFIPQIRISVPYVKLWNYNTMIKIDDKGFNETNPGVWTHSLHELMDRNKFTSWNEYNNDQIINSF